MAFDFTGKTAIVTGGAGGIGSEIAKGIVEGGGHVVVTDINEEAGREFVSSLGEGSHFYKLNIADADEVRSTVGRIVSDIPGINVLINVAGIISAKPFEDIDDAEWNRTIGINLTGTFTMCSAIFPTSGRLAEGASSTSRPWPASSAAAFWAPRPMRLPRPASTASPRQSPRRAASTASPATPCAPRSPSRA